MKNLIEYLYHFTETTPEHPFIIHGDYTITFQKASEQISAISEELIKAGLKPGQTVGILLQNCPEFILVYLAVLNTGAIASLLPWTMPESEIATLATTTRIEFLIYSVNFQEHADQIRNLIGHPIRCYIHGRETGQDARNIYDFMNNHSHFDGMQSSKSRNNAVILFSAGDYSHPKPLVFNHESLISTAIAVFERFPENYRYRIYTSLPYFHYFPFTLVINFAIVTGSTVVIPFDDTREKMYESIHTHGVNVFVSNGGFIQELMNNEDVASNNFESVNYFIPVGDSFSDSVKNTIFNRYNAHIVEAYGVAEAPVIAMNFCQNMFQDTSVGKPLSCCEVKIVDEFENEVAVDIPGFLLVRGSNVYRHYFDRFPVVEKEPLEWVSTGDVVSKDSEGYLHWICKKDDWFYRNGFRVDPNSILSVMQQHPAVNTAVIVNSKQNTYHDQIKLAVMVNENSEIDGSELLNHCNENLPRYLVPDNIEIVDRFDRNCIGIIKKSHITFQEH